MFLYYASFIPGLGEFISSVLERRRVVICRMLDGAVLFETGLSYDKLNFFCFNNIFAVIDVMEHLKDGSKAVESHIGSLLSGKKALSDEARNIISSNSKKFKSFRIVVSRENVPAAVDERLRLDAEKYISALSELKVNRSRPDAEFWFLYRSEGISLFMKRLTLRQSWEKSLHKGELPPPLAWSLCAIAGLKSSDTVLDPFCGYGSIPEEAFARFHVKKFIACDKDKDAVLYCERRFRDRKSGEIVIYKTDFAKLPTLIERESVDALVTDPPWGHYEKIEENFYEKMFDVVGGLLKTGARAVFLCADRERFLKAMPDSFDLLNDIPILLSGKKAGIFILKKKEK